MRLEASKTSQPIRPDDIKSARSVGLRYVTDREPGIRRLNGSLGFRFIGPDGRTLRNQAELQRIRALAVPPAWKDVWLCRDGRGHLQATGRAVKGRKQYRYHAQWRTWRDGDKFDRMSAFAAALPGIRAR